MASAVAFEPVPAMTGTRPRACSTTNLTTSVCSSWVRVAASPVDPHGTSADDPAAIWRSTSLPKVVQSIAPSLKGVTRATIEPPNRVCRVVMIVIPWTPLRPFLPSAPSGAGCRKQVVEVDVLGEDLRRRAGHEDAVVRAPLDVEVAAAEVN